ncbi:DEAD/DEAH box helicase [Thiorhodococcus mannitoliphagus]|uniref:DEAD/DEAH box helicase n=1 Tax=Thiorhodococcus mannitoliphagus TaxID=329406 RepID=A0A6P1DWR8_9GAMM|nr:DEAD/DEAH box helicase [Thiorhodococcus mannitoliphagus]NEX21166.1 DEAD/DEAH box helicase [Thiorhodococcus mannitoliphagus]
MTTSPAPVNADAPPVLRLEARLAAKYRGRIAATHSAPACSAQWRDFPTDFPPQLAQALHERGMERLYSHQRAAWDLARAGRHLVVATPTASGKTLCYNLPVLESVLTRGRKALYLFPTKALAQDQVAELMELSRALSAAGGAGIKAFTFDGDTPGDARKAVRTRGDIVVSNPDMLHQAILPHHTKWAQFFEGLAYVVVDELHSYRGVFGSHVANVFRRLKRICRFYGVEPTFIFASATIANPAELAERLCGEPVEAIQESGAPQGARHLLLWNPPVINPDLGIRASARSQTTRIARMAAKVGLKAIVFARSRLMVEVITKYLKDVFDHDPRRPARVLAYRGGYLPSERRRGEQAMRAGKVNLVVATSALELGVDIGALDVAILNGYPGTVAATMQRLGRAGRRLRPSLGVLVATSDPLDQFLVRHPEMLFGASPEHARIHPDQLLILLEHVRCAAFELPFRDGDAFGGEDLGEMLGYLRDEGVLQHQGDRWYWVADSYPANAVSLRSVAEGNFVVIDTTEGAQTIIAEVDYSSAPGTIYAGAIYMVQSQPYQVERLDWTGRKAFVTRTRADYYTDAIDYTRLKILDRFEGAVLGRGVAANGEVHLVRRYPGYKKIRYYSHDNIGYGNIDLPDQEMHTTSVWWQAEPSALEAALPDRQQAIEGFLGAAYALHHVAALRSMAELHDLGRAVGDGQGTWFAVVGGDGRGQMRGPGNDAMDPAEQDRFEPTLFLYDNYPGGVGLSAPLFDAAGQLVGDARDLVVGCSCAAGCPACVGPVLPGDEERALTPRQAALAVLELLLCREG